ncbi:unnamed protein product [Didymodactylos carnosus]|uniref:Berberine/berberine-like domain-containing protein n=1 Tax=Didymodactylos carnosus TaxID=1234261 RepID=A0A814CRF1_9BILA|nr:unnamed protein product [Didymodactylos carnosus]CAF1231151.1 unnamed protein product [Didymodactylos carnosus]CAF3720965.1 unnamed protein product [Didymodactylos carnosus]CAF4039216.1 unnamed protein product [Didymodactylos carnosus]
MDILNTAVQQQHTNLTCCEELGQSLGQRAKVFWPTTDGYSQAKRIWNSMFDNHSPALIVQPMENEKSDLFWALRGCASNFGIESSSNWVVLSRKLCEAEKVAEPLTKLGLPVQESWVWITHVQNQKLFDDKSSQHRKYYAKSGSIDFHDMTIEFVNSVVDSVNNLTSPYSVVQLVAIGGIMKETSADETSYFHLRKQDWLVNVITSWCEGNGDEHINWCRETFQKLHAKSTAAYLNLMMMDPPTNTTYKEQLNDAFGSNLNKLRIIKKKYDSFNFFHHNLNLLPADDNNDN